MNTLWSRNLSLREVGILGIFKSSGFVVALIAGIWGANRWIVPVVLAPYVKAAVIEAGSTHREQARLDHELLRAGIEANSSKDAALTAIVENGKAARLRDEQQFSDFLIEWRRDASDKEKQLRHMEVILVTLEEHIKLMDKEREEIARRLEQHLAMR